MSQVVTINTKSFICQATDLRVSSVSLKGTVRDKADLLPKTIVVECVNGIYLLGVTGTAKLEGKWTPFWIGEELAKLTPTTTIADSLNHLNTRIDEILRPRKLGFWFSASGFIGSKRFLTLMGNISKNGTAENPLIDEPSFLVRNDLDKLPSMSVIGPPVDSQMHEKIWKRYEKRGLLDEKETYGAVARLGIQIIRQSSSDRGYGSWISPCCNSVCLNWETKQILLLSAPTRPYLSSPFPTFVKVEVGRKYSALATTFSDFVDYSQTTVPIDNDSWIELPPIPPGFVNPDQ